MILMKDANVLLEPDALPEHMRQLTDEVGLVCAIPYCARLDNFAAHVEAAIINGPHARMLFLASASARGLGSARSCCSAAPISCAPAASTPSPTRSARTMRWPRRCGESGCAPFFRTGRCVRSSGARISATSINRQLRWSVIRRDDELLSFLLEPICQALPAFVAAALAAPLVGLSPLCGVAVTFRSGSRSRHCFPSSKDGRYPGRRRLIFLLREAVMLAVWLHAWTTEPGGLGEGRRLDARVAGAAGARRRTREEEG